MIFRSILPILLLITSILDVDVVAEPFRGDQYEIATINNNYQRKTNHNRNFVEASLQSANRRTSDWTLIPACHHVVDEPSSCRPLENGTMCFDAAIPFAYTSTKHMETLRWASTSTSPMMNPNELAERFAIYAGLPECWRLLREVLCGVFYPPCTTKRGGLVMRIPRQLCIEARSKCSFLVKNDLWPSSFGDCYRTAAAKKTSSSSALAVINRSMEKHNDDHVDDDDDKDDDGGGESLDSIFTPSCKVSRNIDWPSNAACVHPLALSDFQPGWIVDHCGLNCTSLRVDLTDTIHNLLWIGLFSITLFTVINVILLHLDDKEIKNHRPYFSPLFWFLICHLALSVCWIVQIVSERRTICRADGSLRIQEPKSVALDCTAQYITLVGSSAGASFWLVAFSRTHYNWRRHPETCEYSQYHHVVAACAVLISFVGGMVLSQVDGDPVLSVCFVSKSSLLGTMWYILPLVLSSFIAFVFYLLLIFCPALKKDEIPIVVVNQGNPSMCQVGFLLMTLIAVHLGSAIIVFVDMMHSDALRKTILSYIECTFNNYHREQDGDHQPSDCQYQSMGDVRMAQFQVLLMAMPALLVDVWLFVCADYGKRFKSCVRELYAKLCKCWRKEKQLEERLASNGEATVIEMASLSHGEAKDDGEVHETRSLERGRFRGSLNYPSTSTLSSGVASDPEGRYMSRGERHSVFVRRFEELRPRHHRRHHRADIDRLRSSKSSLLLAPSTALSSLRDSVPLPLSGTSQASLAFPDLSRYPVFQGSPMTPEQQSVMANAWLASLWQYPPWSWMYCYPNAPTAPASVAFGGASPPFVLPTTSTPEQQSLQQSNRKDDDPSDVTKDQEPSTKPTTNGDSSLSSTMSGTAPPPPQYYWPPYPYPTFPYWPHNGQAMTTAVGSGPEENRLTIQPAPTSPIASSPKVQDSLKQGTIEVDSKNERRVETMEEEKAEDESKEDDDEEEAMDENEYEDEDEEEMDSEEENPEEEMFVQMQLKLLLGK